MTQLAASAEFLVYFLSQLPIWLPIQTLMLLPIQLPAGSHSGASNLPVGYSMVLPRITQLAALILFAHGAA